MQRMRVLFVDDEEELVSAVVERLELRGVEAEGVTDGVEALRRIAEQPFEVVVLDVKMPGLNGLEVIRQIKRMHADLPVVLLSGHSSVVEAEEGLRLGACEYLLKPVDTGELLKILRKAVSDREDSDGRQAAS